MAQFTIGFKTTPVNKQGQAPIYRVELSTVLTQSGLSPRADYDVLLIERKVVDGNAIDMFYGIAKAVDFSTLRKALPNKNQSLYRTHSWNLLFYNLTTLNEAITLMKSQVDLLAADLAALTLTSNNQYDSHRSPEFNL